MVEIYNYDIAAHERFARDQEEIEAFRSMYHIQPGRAGTDATQAQILDLVPKHSAMVLLMQTYQQKSWARFTMPKNYYSQRFSSSYIAPSLGPLNKQNADIHRLQAYLRAQTKEEKEKGEKEKGEEREEEEELLEEGSRLIELLEKGVKDTNVMIDEVRSRMQQFVQA